MTVQPAGPRRTWTVAEARARLSEVLRLAEEEGPQRIGVRKPFVVAPARAWSERAAPPAPDAEPRERAGPRMPFGRWLVENMRIGVDLELPDRASRRPIPFIDDEGQA